MSAGPQEAYFPTLRLREPMEEIGKILEYREIGYLSRHEIPGQLY